jgi:hypothetical protein
LGMMGVVGVMVSMKDANLDFPRDFTRFYFYFCIHFLLKFKCLWGSGLRVLLERIVTARKLLLG